MARTGRPREFDRDLAVQSALTLFWRQGYEPTSLAQLKAAMGDLSPTSFYAAFGSKEALFQEVLTLYLSDPGQVMRVLRDESVGPRQAIEDCLRGSARMQTDAAHPPGCLIVLGTGSCGPSSETVARTLQEERVGNRDAIAAQVRRAVSLGDIPPTTDVDALAGLFNTFLLGISTAARDGASAEQLGRAIDHIMLAWPGPSIDNTTGGAAVRIT